jgi:hypothetical protein
MAWPVIYCAANDRRLHLAGFRIDRARQSDSSGKLNSRPCRLYPQPNLRFWQDCHVRNRAFDEKRFARSRNGLNSLRAGAITASAGHARLRHNPRSCASIEKFPVCPRTVEVALKRQLGKCELTRNRPAAKRRDKNNPAAKLPGGRRQPVDQWGTRSHGTTKLDGRETHVAKKQHP